MRSPALLASLAVTVISSLMACAPKEDSTQSGEADLVNGNSAQIGDLPFNLHVVGNCTVTKVGPKLILTAAHCVLDTYKHKVRADFEPGVKMTVKARAGIETRTLVIAKTHVHPVTLALCTRSSLCSPTAVYDAPDVAVIEVTEEIEGVPIASVDVKTAETADPVTILGYGCTAKGGYSDGVLRTSDVAISAEDALSKVDGYSGPTQRALIEQVGNNFILTPGPRLAAANGGLCPGDSGGPVLRRGTSTIVGINSVVWWDVNGIPAVNWHARVDGKAAHGVAAWLGSIGVQLTEACTEATCTAVDVPKDPCSGVDYRGQCTGSVVEWCDKGEYKTVDCQTKTDGRTSCGLDADASKGFNCIAPPADPCEAMDPRGKCTGTVVEWCDKGAYKKVDCTTKTDGRVACGLDPNPANGFNCIKP